MVKLVDKQTSFNFGVITEKLQARDDLKQYPAAVADAFNFISTKYGPIQKRMGTLFKWDTGNVGAKVRLIPFTLSMKKSIILEFLNYKVRFYTFDGTDYAPIADPQNPTKAYEITSPYSADILEDLSYAQSLNVIYIAAPNGTRPQELRRYADNNWRFVDYTFEDGPYLDQNFNASRRVSVNATTVGDHTLTVEGFSLSQADVGRHIRINHPDPNTLEDRWGWGVIKTVNSATQATVTIHQKIWDTGLTDEFRLGAWGTPHDDVGWPTHVTIHEQRLCWHGTTNFPWLWMSSSFNYNKYSPTDFSGNVKDTNGIAYNMATDKIAPVKWMASLGSLIIGTEMYEMRMYAAGAGLAPGDCVVRKESTYGAHDALPIITDDTLIFIQRLQRALRSVAYDYTRDAYVGPELTVLSEALTVPGLKKLVYQREPNGIIWTLLEDGTLMSVTYDKEQGVTACTRCALAGEDARIIDIVAVPSASFRQDVFIMIVERRINGITRRYMELMSKEYLKDTPLTDVPFLDSALRYRGAPTTRIVGLNHLEGETVTVLSKGALHDECLVVNGAIEFDYPISDGWIGLPYRAYFETLERDFGDKQISTKMGKVRIHRLVVHLIRTLGLTVYQITRGIQTELLTFDPKNKTDEPPEPLTGEMEMDIMTAWTSMDMSYKLVFESKPGLPCTVCGIVTGVEVNAL